MNKLWNSFLSVKETEDAPISLVLHSFGEDTVILALCRGLHLKVWTMDVSGRCYNNGGLVECSYFPPCSRGSVCSLTI